MTVLFDYSFSEISYQLRSESKQNSNLRMDIKCFYSKGGNSSFNSTKNKRCLFLIVLYHVYCLNEPTHSETKQKKKGIYIKHRFEAYNKGKTTMDSMQLSAKVTKIYFKFLKNPEKFIQFGFISQLILSQ